MHRDTQVGRQADTPLQNPHSHAQASRELIGMALTSPQAPTELQLKASHRKRMGGEGGGLPVRWGRDLVMPPASFCAF